MKRSTQHADQIYSHHDKVATFFEVAVDWEPLIPKREAQKLGFGLAGEFLCVHLWLRTWSLSSALSKSCEIQVITQHCTCAARGQMIAPGLYKLYVCKKSFRTFKILTFRSPLQQRKAFQLPPVHLSSSRSFRGLCHIETTPYGIAIYG